MTSARVCSDAEPGADEGASSIGVASGRGLTYAAVPRPDRSDSIDTRSISRAARRRGLASGSLPSPSSSSLLVSSPGMPSGRIREADEGRSIGSVELEVTGTGGPAGATSTSVGVNSPSRKPADRDGRSRCLPLSARDGDDGRSEPALLLPLAPPLGLPLGLSRPLKRRRFGSLRRGGLPLLSPPPPAADARLGLRWKKEPKVEFPPAAADGPSEPPPGVKVDDDPDEDPPPLVPVVAAETARARLRPAS